MRTGVGDSRGSLSQVCVHSILYSNGYLNMSMKASTRLCNNSDHACWSALSHSVVAGNSCWPELGAG